MKRELFIGMIVLVVCAVCAAAQAPEVSHVWPDAGRNEESVSVHIYGDSFAIAPPSVKLTKVGYPDIYGASVNVLSDEYLTCSFDLVGDSTGLYDLLIEHAFGSDTLPGCFSVYSRSAPPYVWLTTSVGDAGGGLYKTTVGDGDDDGEVEVYGASADSYIYQYQWDGGTWVKTAVGWGADTMFDVTVGDGNDDGMVEVYGGNGDCSIYQFRWNGSSWTKSTVGVGGRSMLGVAVGDGNRDGEMEVYGACHDDTLYQFKWNGSSWEKMIVGRRVYNSGVTVGDGNGDGEMEVYLAAADGDIAQFKWEGGIWLGTLVGSGRNWMRRVTLGDGNGDGDIEVYGASGDSCVYQFEWDGMTWVKTIVGFGQDRMEDVAVGDGNGDCKSEVYGANRDGNIYQFGWDGSSWRKTTIGSGTSAMWGVGLGIDARDGKMAVYGANLDHNMYQFRPALLPHIALSDTIHDFGLVHVGDSLDWRYLVIRNRGTADLVVGGISSDEPSYLIVGPPFPDTIVPDDSIDVTVRFRPSSEGPVQGTLSVFSNDPDQSPVHIGLAGQGYYGPNIALSDTAHDFGGVVAGGQADWEWLVVKNTGAQNLLVNQISSDTAAFRVLDPSFPQIIVPDDSILVTVRFKPLSAGVVSGALAVSSNDPAKGLVYVGLTGECYATPDIELSDTTHDFGGVAVGDSMDWKSLIIRNLGFDTLVVDSLVSDNVAYTVPDPSFPYTVVVDDSATVTVRFVPQFEGTVSGTLWVHSNDPDEGILYVAITGEGLTGIEKVASIRRHFSLEPKSNPARGNVIFCLEVPEAGDITLRIYDVAGRLIDMPLSGRKPAGKSEISCASNMPSGVYFYCIESPWGTKSGKFVLIE